MRAHRLTGAKDPMGHASTRQPIQSSSIMIKPYLSETEAPSRSEVDGWTGCVVLEFGTEWCSHCRAARDPLITALAAHPQWQHVKVEDGPGRALGRSYRVKQWPTLVLLIHGQERERLVRPTQAEAIEQALGRAQASS